MTKCSGEGIYFAAKSGRMAGEAVVKAMAGGTKLPTEAELDEGYLKPYDKLYFPTYTVLDILQKVFYTHNAAREAFVHRAVAPAAVATRAVRGTNRVLTDIVADRREGGFILLSAIDNLTKQFLSGVSFGSQQKRVNV